jgi:hypothetical protein
MDLEIAETAHSHCDTNSLTGSATVLEPVPTLLKCASVTPSIDTYRSIQEFLWKFFHPDLDSHYTDISIKKTI